MNMPAPIGFVGSVMKGSEKVGEFKMQLMNGGDGTQRAVYDNFDFIGVHGIKRRDWRWLFMRKKRDKNVKIFRYSPDWVLLSDTGGISFWDQTTQAQLPLYALQNPTEYKKITEVQQKANDVLYYGKDGVKLIKRLATPKSSGGGLAAFALPALLIGAIILVAIINLYAAQQWTQAHGGITTAVTLNITKILSHIAGLS